MNHILKYSLFFVTSIIFSENLENIESVTETISNTVENNCNDIKLDINLKTINLQHEIDEMKKPKLLKYKIAFFTFITVNIAFSLLTITTIFDYDFNDNIIFIFGLISLHSSLYCIFRKFSNYTYIPLIFNPFLIYSIINNYSLKILVKTTIFTLIFAIIPNYIKGYMHKKKIEFKKLKTLKIKELEELKNTYQPS